MQEDLEAEFQSLFSLLEELKEGMLMKIKQDRASRTYELQVCVIWGGAGGGVFSQTPSQMPSPAHSPEPDRPQHLPPNLLLLSCPFPEGPPVSLVSQARPSSGVSHTSSFPWALPSPLPGHDLSIPHAPALPLNPFSPALLQPHPYIWLFLPTCLHLALPIFQPFPLVPQI